MGEFADRLRRARRERGLERADLARILVCSLATIQRAEAGKRLPPLPTARAYATACGLDPDEIEEAWQNARARTHPARRRTAVPSLGLAADAADLAALLLNAYVRAGAPSYREMERRANDRAGNAASLSRSTIGRILTGQQLPTTEERLLAFLTACRVPEHAFGRWLSAYRRVRRHEQLAARWRHAVRTAESSWNRARQEDERALTTWRAARSI
ncbi:helix-turn-helix transcriptional regulator [Streptomyces sp. NPDC095602]|uniref:helix-turn-helix domain-containing protein n=1 Tax=Streptomyces sp. NPDC095602 TaxID=3155819 RepID=UPI0033309A0D